MHNNLIIDSNLSYYYYGIHIQEWLAVKHGIKPVLRTVLRTDKFEYVEKLCRKEGLSSLIKPFTQLYGTKLNSPINIIYVSRSKDLLEEAYLSDKSGDREKLGELLGYPSCCVDFFSEALKDAESPFPVKTYLKTNGKPSFLVNNVFKLESRLSSSGVEKIQKNPDFANRISHLFLISHIPCSYTCKESIDTGKEILTLLKREEPEVAKEIEFTLRKPLLFFDDFNWIIFNGKASGNTLDYASILPPLSLMPGNVVSKFRDGDKVEVGKEYVEIFRNGEIIHRIKKKHKYDGILLDFS